MVAVQHPRADCGHAVALVQQCGRCLRWCCPECYAPWTALACSACRAQAPAAAAPAPGAGAAGTARCRGRARPAAGSRRHREQVEASALADRVAALERRLQALQELKFGT